MKATWTLFPSLDLSLYKSNHPTTNGDSFFNSTRIADLFGSVAYSLTSDNSGRKRESPYPLLVTNPINKPNRLKKSSQLSTKSPHQIMSFFQTGAPSAASGDAPVVTMSTSTPVFSFGHQVQDPSSLSNNHNHNHNNNNNRNTTTPSFPSFTTSFSSPYQPQYRPKISSPLSSSPIRPFDSMSRSSPPGSPTSKPRGIFGGQSQTQSSPIFGSFLQSQGQGHGQAEGLGQGEASNQNGQAAADGQQGQGQNNKFLKYNSRPSRPMNHPSFSSNRKEDRRRLFLQNVRQRADDKAWERRGGENELLKLEWLRFNRELRLAKEASAPPNPFNPQFHNDTNGFALEQEIEELAQLRAKFNHQQQFLEGLLEDQPPGTEGEEQEKYQDMDAYMADMIAREEEAELEALLALNQQAQEDLRVREGQQGQGQQGQQQGQQQGDEFMEKDDDEDEYDALFMEVLAQQQQQQQQHQPNDGDLGIQHHHQSQDDVEMGG